MTRSYLNAGISYEEFCQKLIGIGFFYDAGSCSWRHPANGASATEESLQDLCKFHPIATGVALNILNSDRPWSIKVDISPDCLRYSMTIEPLPLLDQIAKATS